MTPQSLRGMGIYEGWMKAKFSNCKLFLILTNHVHSTFPFY